jgi:hypothetical protein
MTSASNGRPGELNEDNEDNEDIKLLKRIEQSQLGKRINTKLGWIIVCLIIQATVWLLFITATERGHYSLWALLPIGLALLLNALFVNWAVKPSDLIGVITVFVSFVLLLIGIFSYFYWYYGTAKNFSISLTHFDALYFAIGTLGTGTGTISASNTTGRVLQSVQMTTDFILIVLIAGTIIARISDGKSNRAGKA